MAIHNVFVTVGTTEFDKLITTVLSEEMLNVSIYTTNNYVKC